MWQIKPTRLTFRRTINVYSVTLLTLKTLPGSVCCNVQAVSVLSWRRRFTSSPTRWWTQWEVEWISTAIWSCLAGSRTTWPRFDDAEDCSSLHAAQVITAPSRYLLSAAVNVILVKDMMQFEAWFCHEVVFAFTFVIVHANHMSVIRQVIAYCTSDDAIIVSESFQHWHFFSHITVDLLNFSALLSLV